MYSIELSQRAQKFLEKLDEHVKGRIERRLKRLEDNPVPSDAKFIGRTGENKTFRVRIGDFRALYRVKDPEKVILIAKIDKRPRIYHR